MLRPLALALSLSLAAPAAAQLSPIGPKQEFRGAWIATVANLDWPRDPRAPSSAQQAELVALLDGLEEAGVNAVIFQVRPEGDALYASEIEPWSYWLTAEQGAPPDPFYDPLEFVVDEAHKRGMELHAWFNPYRADRGSDYPKAPNHVTNEHPEWLLTVGPLKIFDPGLQASRDRVAAVVADVVRRYDVDGVHFDDYFYPYPPNTISNQDAASFAADPRGFTDIGDWRRDNVDLMVAQVQDSVLAVRPEVAFGISPFGIWRNGVPTGVAGLDAYNVIYSDPLAWMDAQTVDYLAPQLYWSSQRTIDTDGDGTPDLFNRQRFTTLAPWWGQQRNGRHVYPGMAAYRIGQAGYGPEELPTQIRYTRANDDLDGFILFRARNVGVFPSLGLRDSLRTDLHRRAALTPTMPWKRPDAPADPTALAETWDGDRLTLTWTTPEPAAGAAAAKRYAVYRVNAADPGLPSSLDDPEHLIAVTGERTVTDRPVQSAEPYHYVVTAVSANSVESGPTNVVTVTGRAVSAGGAPEAAPLAMEAPRPNPSRGATELRFSLDAPARVTLRVVDVLGREVARVLDGEPLGAGAHAARWDGAAAPGTYVVVLDADGRQAARPLTRMR